MREKLSTGPAARLANVSDQTIRRWCETVPGLAERDALGRWLIDAGQLLRLVEARARMAQARADGVRAALSDRRACQ